MRDAGGFLFRGIIIIIIAHRKFSKWRHAEFRGESSPSSPPILLLLLLFLSLVYYLAEVTHSSSFPFIYPCTKLQNVDNIIFLLYLHVFLGCAWLCSWNPNQCYWVLGKVHYFYVGFFFFFLFWFCRQILDFQMKDFCNCYWEGVSFCVIRW